MNFGVDILLAAVLGIVTWCVAAEGAWGAAAIFLAVLFSGLLAMNFFEPLADFLQANMASSWHQRWDVISLVGLFAMFDLAIDEALKDKGARPIEIAKALNAVADAYAYTSSVSESKLAVKIDNQCGTSTECKLKVETEAEGTASAITTNAQSILNTLASVNAVQVNVNASGNSQSNMAFSAEGVVSEIDSAEIAVGGTVGSSHADGTASGSSHATSAGASGAGNSTIGVTSTTDHSDGNSNQNTSVTATADSDADAAAASSASSATTSASSSASSGGAFTSASAASALAFATPKVKIYNQCGTQNCKLKVETEAENGGVLTTNAQSILNTLASVNAVQINVSGGAVGAQSNIAFSTVK